MDKILVTKRDNILVKKKIDEKILYSYKTYTPVNKSVNEDILDNINDTESSK